MRGIITCGGIIAEKGQFNVVRLKFTNAYITDFRIIDRIRST